MVSLLRWISDVRPWKVFATFFLSSLLTAPFRSSGPHHPVLFALGSVIGALLLFGYPVLITFGFPGPYSTAARRRITFSGAALVCIGVTAGSLGVLPASPTLPDWVKVVAGIPLLTLVYAPFFVATGIIDDARRAAGHYKVLDCIGTWICVFGYPVWGVFFIQRNVASALAALDAKLSGS